MRGTRIIAIFVALATVIATLSILSSCGGEKEPEFTVPHLNGNTSSEKSETESQSTETVDTESGVSETGNTESSGTSGIETGNTETGDIKTDGTESTGSEVPAPVNFSTIPLPGEEGYKDRLNISTTQQEGMGGVIFDRFDRIFDKGFEDYPIDYLKEIYYGYAYMLKTQHADELASEPLISNYVETVWQRAQGYRPILFNSVAKGNYILPVPITRSFTTTTFENKVAALLNYVKEYFDFICMTKNGSDGISVYIYERGEDYYEAIGDYCDFFQTYYGNIFYPSVNSALKQIAVLISNAFKSGSQSAPYSDMIAYMGFSSKFSVLSQYDSEKMKLKVTYDYDGYDYLIAAFSGKYDTAEKATKRCFVNDVLWLDPAAYASVRLSGAVVSGFAPDKANTHSALSQADRLPDRTAVINSAALKMAVESFLGITSPTVKDLSAIVGIEWTKDTITLTNRKGVAKNYQSNGVCKDEATFDDFVSLADFSIDASGLSGDVFTRNCFLSLDSLTVTDYRAEKLNLSELVMLSDLYIRDCPELRGINLGDNYRFMHTFEFSGKKNPYIRSLDFLSNVLEFMYLDLRALSIEDIGGFRGHGSTENEYAKYMTLKLGDLYDADFFTYCYNIWNIEIYGSAPSDEVILAKVYEDREHASRLNLTKKVAKVEFSIKRY